MDSYHIAVNRNPDAILYCVTAVVSTLLVLSANYEEAVSAGAVAGVYVVTFQLLTVQCPVRGGQVRTDLTL